MALVQVTRRQRHAPIQIDQRQIGIHSHLDRTFAAYTKAPRRLRREERADALERHCALV